MDIKFSLFETSKNENSNLVLSFSNYRHMFNQSDEYSAFFGKNILTKQGKSIYLTSKEKAYWPEQAYEALKKQKWLSQ